MQDALAYCAELVRSADRDRFIATLFAPEPSRGALHALYAFAIEVERVREAARQPLPGEIRLQWWIDVLRGERGGEAAANPVAAALLAAIERHGLPRDGLMDLVEAHRFDLYEAPPATVVDLEGYARKTSSVLFALAARVLAGTDAASVTEPAGIAHGVAGLLRALPFHAASRRLHVPAELLERHTVQVADIFAGRSSQGLEAALAELRDLVRRHLAAARPHLAGLCSEALPALLPLALVRPLLARLDRCGVFEPTDLTPWRRQWLLWRAARNPARMVG